MSNKKAAAASVEENESATEANQPISAPRESRKRKKSNAKSEKEDETAATEKIHLTLAPLSKLEENSSKSKSLLIAYST